MAAAQLWPPERMRSWQVLRASFGKLAFQQRAQPFGPGHALREGRYLDARPHRGRDVEGQARGVEVAFLDAVGVALTNPRLGRRVRRWTCAAGHTRKSDGWGKSVAD